MADPRIDFFEVDEYGKHFLTQVDKLDGASDVVNVAAVKTRVADAMALVGVEREKAGIQRSNLRSGRTGTTDATATGRQEIERRHRGRHEAQRRTE